VRLLGCLLALPVNRMVLRQKAGRVTAGAQEGIDHGGAEALDCRRGLHVQAVLLPQTLKRTVESVRQIAGIVGHRSSRLTG
jgi:hypothetical protein